MKQLVLAIIILFSFGDIFAQTEPRLVVPVGHTNHYNVNKHPSSDPNFLFTTETITINGTNPKSILLVWDTWSKKEVFRIEINGEDQFDHLIFEDPSTHTLLFNAKDVFIRVNFEHDTFDTLSKLHHGHLHHIDNTPLFLIGNKDSVAFYDLNKFQFVAEYPINIWNLVKWSTNANQSGSFDNTSVFLLKSDKESSQIFVYNPNQVVQLRQIEFDFGVKKVFLINEHKIILEKEEVLSGSVPRSFYPYDLKFNTFQTAIPCHQYAINGFEHHSDGGFISFGNDKRLLLWDSTFSITKEINVFKSFHLPSFTKLVDTEDELLFEARIKKNKPNQSIDSLILKGVIEKQSFLLTHIDTTICALDTVDYNQYDLEQELQYIYGLDKPYEYLSNKDNRIQLRSEIDSNYSEILTITSDFKFKISNIRTDSLKKSYNLIEPFNSREFNDLNEASQFDFFAECKSLSTEFIDPDFIDDLQTSYFKEKKSNLKNWDENWQLNSTCIRQDSTKFVLYDSLFYRGKLILNDSTINRDTIYQPSSLVPLDKHMCLIRKLNDDTLQFTLLKSGKILDQVTLIGLGRIPFDSDRLLLTSAYDIPWGEYNTTFSDFPIHDLERYFIYYPGRKIHNQNNRDEKQSYDVEMKIKELVVSNSKLKLVSVDSLFKTDYLEKKTDKFLFNTTNDHLFYDYKNVKMWYSPGLNFHKIEMQRENQLIKFYISKTSSYFNSLDWIYWQTTYNNLLSAHLLKSISQNNQHNEFYIDQEQKAIFQISNQKYVGNNIETNQNEVFLGCFLAKNLFVVLDEETNFYHVRNFNNQELFSFILLEDGQYLFFDKDYHFDGHPAAISQLYLTCGLEVVELSQIKDAMYVPNLVQRILNGEDLNHLPKLSDISICGITPKVVPIKNKNGKASFKITPQSGGIGEIEIQINGVLREIKNPAELKFHQGSYLLEIDPNLIESFKINGQSAHINVVAKTKNNLLASRGATIEVIDEVSSFLKPSLYALMIGIDSYKDPSLTLNYAAKDANDLQQVLQTSAIQYFNIDDTNRVFFYNLTIDKNKTIGTTQLKGLTPDKGNIIKTLEYISMTSKPEDIILLFFAGHGEIIDNNQLLLLTAEATKEQPIGIRMKDLLDYMNKIPAGKRVLILDSCHSGAAINDLDMAIFAGTRDISEAERESRRLKELDKLASKSGFSILTASSSKQKAMELPQYEHVLLTYSLLSAIVNNPYALSNDHVLVLDKWFIAAEEEMQKISSIQNAEKFIPVSFNLGVVNDEVKQNVQIAKTPSIFIENVLNINEVTDDLFIKNQLISIFQSKEKKLKNSFLYVDLADALRVNIIYEHTDSKLKCTVNLRNGLDLKTFTYESEIQKIDELLHIISDDIIRLLLIK